MVTMFVITGLAMVGLPMLNGFVGEFLILSGSMQTSFTHHLFWTVVATLGVILSAAYVLTMIQRVFYTELGPRAASVTGWDLDSREHLALWPMALLFLVMGIAPTIWLRAINTAATPMASQTTVVQSDTLVGQVNAVSSTAATGGAR